MWMANDGNYVSLARNNVMCGAEWVEARAAPLYPLVQAQTDRTAFAPGDD